MPALLTLNFDGTLTVGVGIGTTYGPGHGVWVKTGGSSIGATTLVVLFDTFGVLTGYQRNRCLPWFNKHFNSYQGVEFMETVSCEVPFSCPDPLDPATQWNAIPQMPPGGFPVSGKRVQWRPAGTLKP